MVLFLRRFGCQVCRWIAKETSKLKDLLESHNVRLIGVGPESIGLQEFIDGNYFKGGRTRVWELPPSKSFFLADWHKTHTAETAHLPWLC